MNPWQKIRKILVWPAIGLIRGYQKFVSPLLGPRCKYYPSCSAYTLRALQVHGLGKGSVLGIWRILRCNPLSDGGVDHVPLPGQWKNPWTYPGSITEDSYRTSHQPTSYGQKRVGK